MAITQAGSVLRFTMGTANTGTVSSAVTVPTDAEIALVGVTGYRGVANYFSAGGMTLTKGGADTAMTVAITGAGSGDNSTSAYMSALFWMVFPDTGSSKVLKWDWSGTTSSDEPALVSVTFWKGVDTADPVRYARGAQSNSAPLSTPTLTASSGDLIVAWVGGYASAAEGTIDTWSNLTELSEVVRNTPSDGAWATTSPTGNTTVGMSTDTNFSDLSIIGIVLKPAAAAAAGSLVPQRRVNYGALIQL